MTNSGIDHEHSAAVGEAAQWYAMLPVQERIQRPAVVALRERFGLSALEACMALREATMLKTGTACRGRQA